MSRPSELQVSLALDVLSATADEFEEHPSFADQRRALAVVRRALTHRPVCPAKEAAAILGVHPSNLGGLRGLPAPAQVFDRPSSLHPDKKMNLYFVDEIEEFAARRRAERGGT